MFRAVAFLLTLATACGSRSPAGSPPEPAEQYRLAGEHEDVGELILAWSDDVADTLEQIIALASPRVSTTVLVDPAIGQDQLRSRLEAFGIDTTALVFLELPTTGPWVRDYGPITLLGSRGGRRVLDFRYDVRPADDDIPLRLVESLWPGASVVHAEVTFHGGNLISDGEGICVTANDGTGITDHRALGELLERHGACRSLVIVPALVGEPTGHVDMFVFSPGPGRMVVGSYSPRDDFINAMVLDEAARLLQVAGLRVDRIPMPDHSDGVFRTYTNLLSLGELVLVPSYDDVPTDETRALEVISEAFPGREVLPVDARSSIELEGALHCLAQTVARKSR